MAEKPSAMEVERWKRKYYDHLDLLDKKEKSWEQLESILKKAVMRLSLAAEGQHASIDQHLQDIRGVVKTHVNAIKLDSILEDLSRLLVRLEDKMGAADSKVVAMLANQLERLKLPAEFDKRKDKLVRKLSKSSDKNREALAEEVHAFLALVVKQDVAGAETQDGELKGKTGLLKNLFGRNEQELAETVDYQPIVNGFVGIGELLPWPAELATAADAVLVKLTQCGNLKDIREQIRHLHELAVRWGQLISQQPITTLSTPDSQPAVVIKTDIDLEHYRQCLTSMLTYLEESGLKSGDSQEISQRVDKADSITELEKLASELAQKMTGNGRRGAIDANVDQPDNVLISDENEPSIQEILIRLLEQLLVQPDLHNEVESLKRRIENDSSGANWKPLLKDVARLINTIRSRMQQEKQEFESFLQQITGRLQEMDSFLATETASLNAAEQAGDNFDTEVNSHVQNIRDDMNSAEDLNDLKSKVEVRLNIVSQHIKEYRESEQNRYIDAQKNVEDMQSRLVMLEQESGDLRRLILEKNKEAMFDVLTEIPNRLSYEKKAAEEIARCNRFSTSLCMAVWDVDLFKQVNDTYGHKAGDRVLKAIAQLLNDRIRETDFIARYGGEEFVMFFSGTEKAEALKVADALREKVASCKFNHHGETARITVSCGISQFIEGDTHETMFERADSALYQAKKNGRNQCVLASD